MFKGFYYGLCLLGGLLGSGCQAARSPAHEPSPVPVESAEQQGTSDPSPTATALVAPVTSASSTPVQTAVTPSRAAPDAGPPASDVAPKTAQKPVEHCTAGYLMPECYAAFPEQVTCPKERTSVPIGEYCGLEGRTRPAVCSYATATCKCTHVPYCGGVTPTQLQQQGMVWVCAPPRKAGDCPEAAARGGQCSSPGQQCSYGGCGSLTECTCSAGKYRCQDRILPSPP